MPQIYGLSHNARGEGYEDKKSGKFIVNKVAEVRHVDLVADPATTHSLAESASQQKTEEAAYSGVGYKSKKRDPGARRGYTKSKEKVRMTRIAPKESEDGLTKEQGKYDKLHAKIIDVLSHGAASDSLKADQIVDIFNKHKEGGEMDDEEKKKMAAEEAVADDEDSGGGDAEEAKCPMCEKCKAKMESCCGEAKDEDEAEEAKKAKGRTDDDDEDSDSSDVDESKEEEEEEDTEEKYAAKESIQAKATAKNIKALCESHKLKFDNSLVSELSEIPEAIAEKIIKRLANAERLLKPKSAAKVEKTKTGIDALEGKQIFNWLKN